MDYDFRKDAAAYDASVNRQTASTHGHGSSFYPRIGQPVGPPVSRASFLSNPSSSSGLGIRVAIKPDFRITPPPLLSPQVVDIPRSTFQFDFDFERKILTEADKGSQQWNRIAMENYSSKMAESSSSGNATDPVVNKYVASGLSREAASIAVANYGDNPTKVREFVNAYNLFREMGFASKTVAGVLAMYDNDKDKALAHFLNNSS